MKKAIFIILVLVAIGAGIFFWPKGTETVAGPTDLKPFDKEVTLDESAKKFFIEGDTYATLAGSGRFYWGAAPMPFGMAAEYEQARKEKVEDIVQESRLVAEETRKAIPKVQELRAAFFDFLDVLKAHDADAMAVMQEPAGEIFQIESNVAVSLSAHESFLSVQTDDPFASAMMQEMGTYMGAAAGAELLRLVDAVALASVTSVLASESHKSPEVVAAGKKLDQAMGGLDQLTKDLKPVGEHLYLVDFGIKQLENADYQFAMAAVEWMDEEAVALQASLENLQPNSFFDEGDIQYVKAYSNLMITFKDDMKARLAETKPVEMPEMVSYDYRPGLAYADDTGGSYAEAFQRLGQKAAGAARAAGEMASATWSGLKTAARKTQRGIQFSTDYAGMSVRMASRIGWGIYYGNKWSEIKQDLREYSNELRDNWNGKLPPKTTLRQAKEMLDELERAIDEGVAQQVAKKTGEGWTSWGAGKLAKTVAGAFNGLAKGVYLIADPSSTDSDYVEGGLEIVFAVAGGSKTVFRASNSPAVLKAAGEVAQEGGRFWTRNRLQAELARLSKEIGEDAGENLARTMSNLREMASIRQAMDAMKVASQEFAERLGKQATEWFKGGAKEAGKSMNDLFRQKFGDNLRGLAEAIRSATGESLKEVFDNVIAGVTDDAIKAQIASLFADRLERDEIRGFYYGNMTITALKFKKTNPDKREDDEEGCMDLNIELSDEDMEKIMKELVNKPNPIRAHINPKDDETGWLVLTEPDGKGDPMRFEYTYKQSGDLIVEKREHRQLLRMEGKFNKLESGEIEMNIKGDADSSGASASLKIEVTKPVN